MNVDLMAAALAYVERGWPVLPLHTWEGDRCSCRKADCPSPAKHPNAALVPNGLTNATTEATLVRKWWTRFPASNIGLRTGVCFDVLDVDGPEGRESLIAHMAERGVDLGAGPWGWTGGDGDHLLYLPTGNGNRAGVLPHVDWRGSGGYIVAAPSLHPSGNRYEWETSNGREGGPDVPLEPAPAWLVELVGREDRLPHRGEEVRTTIQTSGSRSRGSIDRKARYGQAALEGEVGRLALLAGTSGTRNETLNKAAFRLGQLLVDGHFACAADVSEPLLRVALAIGLGEHEARATIESGLRSAIDRAVRRLTS